MSYILWKTKYDVFNNVGPDLCQYHSPSSSSASFPFLTSFSMTPIRAKLSLAKSIYFGGWSLFPIWNLCMAFKQIIWYLCLSKLVCTLSPLSTQNLFWYPNPNMCKVHFDLWCLSDNFHLNLTKIWANWNKIWWWQCFHQWNRFRVLFICRAPHHEECLKHHGHKGDPGITPRTCGALGERAQVILVWVRALGVGNASHPRILRGTRIKPLAMCSLWHVDSRMLKITSIGGAS